MNTGHHPLAMVVMLWSSVVCILGIVYDLRYYGRFWPMFWDTNFSLADGTFALARICDSRGGETARLVGRFFFFLEPRLVPTFGRETTRDSVLLHFSRGTQNHLR